jgi:nucleotide-binding universal stress UspA family protein
MRVLRSILIATDFSSSAERASQVGTALARRYGATVRVVSVVEPPHVYQRLVTPVQTSLASTEEASRRLEERLRTWTAGALFANLTVHTGNPFGEIIAAARDGACDLIVIGTKGAHGAARLLLGSTAERIIRKSPLPVLVAKTDLPEQPRLITVPVDFSASALRAAQEGIALAKRWQARLEFLHVIEPITQTYVWPAEPAGIAMFPVDAEAIEPEWQHFLAQLSLEGVQWTKRTLKGTPAETIVQATTESASDLLVIGTHGHGALFQILLGNVAAKVVRDVRCCVLTIRPESFQFELP